MTASSRTTERFAYTVASLDDLEPTIAALLRAQIKDEAIRKIVIAPRQQRLGKYTGWRRWLAGLLPWQLTPSWVLALTSERLLVAEIAQPGDTPTLHSIPAARLLAIELGELLLVGWLTCSWVGHGRVETIQVCFNTVSDAYFWEILRALCRDSIQQSEAPAAPGERHLERLDLLPFMYRSLIPYRQLLKDECVHAVIYQPAIWERKLLLFRRRLSPTTVVLLSNYHLMLTSDEKVPGNQATHGVIARYYPLSRIIALNTEKTAQGIRLEIQAGIGDVYETQSIFLEREAENDVRELIDQIGRTGKRE
ncbi:MAG: hypothetical protein BroJett021_19510 [Chloroflexota bacterium]|jgi:hypothetical protein|nr:hypothetical protein [Caldilinea sp.]GIK72963.1 MAG: hypothetical protein BroJett021_19510 [Chloroflexota bacterium]